MSARANALWLCVAFALTLFACAGPAPLSRSRPVPTTTPPPPPPVTMLPSPVPSEPPPDVETRPALAPAAPPGTPIGSAESPREVAANPAVTAGGAPPVPPASVPTTDTIALVLPLQSPLYGHAGDAVKAGFLAAAKANDSGARVQVIGHADDGVLPAFASAADAGVALIVGPLTRDDLKTVLTMAPVRPRMLALNQPDDGTPLPQGAYALALSVESDAALLARQARDDGVRTLASVTGDAPLQRRFRAAFAAAWEHFGGAIMRDYRFDRNPDVLALMRRELAARGAPDAILLCVGPGDAALAKSFLTPGPVYASSQVTDGVPAEMLHDLEGVRYVEIPWLADPDDPALSRLPKASMGDPVLDRLYALGLDAFTLAELLASPEPPARIELDGATGHLSLAPGRFFLREGRVMIIRGGVPTPYSPRQ